MPPSLFSLGSNGSGQLGIGHKEDVSVPKPAIFHHHHRHNSNNDGGPATAPDDDTIVKVAAGGNHTIVLTASGKAYWAGDASQGACGITSIATADNAAFEELVLFDPQSAAEAADSQNSPATKITHVACTWDSSTFVLRSEGGSGTTTRVYSCGTGAQGQLGITTTPANKGGVVAPSPIPDFPPPGRRVVDLAGGLAHMVAVLDDGEVYGWGNGRKGQLGQALALDDDGAAPVPRVLYAPDKIGPASGVDFKVARAVCGQYSTCLIGAPGEGRIVCLGVDKWGVSSAAPAAVPDWKDVSSAWGGVYVLKQDGTVTAWGRDDHGQLPPPNLPRIKQIAAGSEHVVALTEEDEVISWGWGEHGNCGPQTEGKSGDVKGRWNVIASSKNMPEGFSIAAIGAGCATSWIHLAVEGVHL